MEKDNIRIIRLKEIMGKRGMTARELATKAKISEATISRYLSGKLSPKIDSIQALAKALNVDPVWLLGYDPVVPEHDTLPGGGFHGGESNELNVLIETLSPNNKAKVKEYIDFIIQLEKKGDES